MRLHASTLVKFAFVTVLVMAAPAASQQADRGGLKGPKGGEKSASTEPPAGPVAAPPPLSLPASPITPGPAPTPAQAADQCRTICARNYYFCLSGDTPDDCPNSWSQCRLTCNGSLSGG